MNMEFTERFVVRPYVYAAMALAFAFGLSACEGGGGGDDGSAGEQNTTVQLGAFSAPTAGAQCVLSDSGGNALGQAQTGADGTVTLTLEPPSGLLTLTCTGGQYIDEATGDTIGDDESAPTLHAAVQYSGGNLTLIATPLSAVAYLAPWPTAI